MLFYAIFFKLPWLSDEVGRSDEWIDPSLIQVVRGFMEGAVERQGLNVEAAGKSGASCRVSGGLMGQEKRKGSQ